MKVTSKIKISKANGQFLQGPGPNLRDESAPVFLCPISRSLVQDSCSWKRASALAQLVTNLPWVKGERDAAMNRPTEVQSTGEEYFPKGSHASAMERRGKWFWAGRNRCSLWTVKPGCQGNLQWSVPAIAQTGPIAMRSKWESRKLCSQPQRLGNFLFCLN